MNPPAPSPNAFAPIARHGVIGDRRTGALVAADGTLSWFCVPDFDGAPLFGALLDPERGGFCRFAPRGGELGQQRYLPGTAVLVTAWMDAASGEDIELTYVGDKLTRDDLVTRIVNGGVNMPAFGNGLKPGELDALVAFLQTRKRPVGPENGPALTRR